MNRKLFILLTAVFGLLALNACKDSERSSATGWKYNDAAWGGFEKLDYEGQETGPNLVLIPGGSFTMGLTDEDVLYEWNNVPRQVTVSSFYIDETEVSNIDYREFMHWTKKVFGSTYPKRYKGIVPDTLVWREELSMNEPYIENYLRHPAYNDYPVVGVSWLQANEYCDWRTDRVNEMMMIEKGIINPNPDQKDSDNFNTESYLAGQYQPVYDKPKTDLVTGEERPISRSDGILLPSYRLPTEAEWEYAALALVGNQATTGDEVVTDRRIFGWDGYTARHKRRDKNQGKMMANFKRGAGDYMGIAGALNDNASIPAPVRSFLPNDFGLYNMSGNVAEWVADIYRPMTSSTLRDVENHDLNPYRGGRYYELITDENGAPIEKDSLGRLQYRIIADSTVADRENFKRGDVSNYLDGDDEELVSYDYGRATLINSKSRVIKGGSWADRLYWLSPGARKFKDEDQSSRDIGFRCAMHRVGGPTGNEDTGGLDYGSASKKKSKKRY